jgi:hypothetical protein
VDTERKARVYPLYLAVLRLLLRCRLAAARVCARLVYYNRTYTRITGKRIHDRLAHRHLHERRGAAGRRRTTAATPARERG